MHTMAQALLFNASLQPDPSFSAVKSLISLNDGTGANPPADAIGGVVWANAINRQDLTTSFAKFGAGSSFRGNGGASGGYAASITYVGALSFTADIWMYFTSYYAASPDLNRFWDISGGGGGHSLYIDQVTGQVGHLNGSFGGTLSGVVPGLNTWRLFSLQADGTTIRLFMDGVQILAIASSNALPQTGNVSVYSPGRCARGNGDYYGGYMDEARLTLGVARYTAAGFPLPTAPFPRF